MILIELRSRRETKMLSPLDNLEHIGGSYLQLLTGVGSKIRPGTKSWETFRLWGET
jgi:hypothetical protein